MIKSRIFSKAWYKSKLFWASFIFVLYSFLGWVIIPWVAKDQLIQILKQQAGWHTKIDSVILNPYALSLTIDKLEIDDGQQRSIVSFDRLYVNYGLTALVNGDIRFQEISLKKPDITLDILADGSTNFQNDFAQHATKESENTTAAETTPEESGEPLQWVLDRLAIANGQIHINDLSQGRPIALQVSPLTFDLQNFSTHINKQGEYQLDLSLGDQQQISWKGNIAVAPFRSQGVIKLDQISAELIAQYANQFSPFPLQAGRLGLNLPYKFSQSSTKSVNDKNGKKDKKDAQIEFLLSDASVKVSQLALAAGTPEGQFLDIEQLTVNHLDFDLGQKELKIGDINIDSPVVQVSRNQDEVVNILQSLQSNDSSAKDQPESESKPSAQEPSVHKVSESQQAFRWAIANINLNKGLIHWQDQVPEQDADIQIRQLDIALSDLQQDLAQAFNYSLDFMIDDSTHHLQGKLAPAPLQVSGQIDLKQLPLPLIQPYLSENLNVELASGASSLKGQYQFASNQNSAGEETLGGNFEGDLRVDNLETRDSIKQQKLAGWQALAVDGIKLKLAPVIELALGKVTLTAPYGSVLVDENQQVNLSTLAKASVAEDDNKAENKNDKTTATANTNATQDQQGENKLQLRLGEFALEKGRFDFADLSQKPPFKTYLNEIQGSIVDLSSDPQAKSKVDIQGQLENAGKLAIKGSLNPLSPSPNLDLTMGINNIDLSVMSTYSGRYAGYAIDKGKLNLDLDYKIAKNHLKAGNHVILDQLTMGDSVDSPDAASLPIPLALALLKDSGGVIDVTLPVEGDLNDPSFSIGGVLLTAVTNLITKAATAPFAILGALVPGGDDIGSVSFAPGQTGLDINQQSKVTKLAEALAARPNLLLEIRGIAAPKLDSVALQTAKAEALLTNQKKNMADLPALESLTKKLVPADQLAAIVAPVAKNAGTPVDPKAMEDYRQQLFTVLAKQQQVASVDLLKLAKTRAANLRDLILSNKQIQAEQVFMAEPNIELAASGDRVTLEFNLSPR